MAQPNPLKDVLELVARLPWWVGLVLAFMSFTVLRLLATGDLPSGSADRTVALDGGFFKGLAVVLQYVVPILFLVAAAVSAFSRFARGTR